MKYSYGITSFVVGDIDHDLGGNIKDELNLTAGVYKDTIVIEEAEGTETEHYVEGRKAPVVSIDEAGKTTITLQFADTSAKNKQRFMGGEIQVINDIDNWYAPDGNVAIEKYIIITTKDGCVMQFPKVKVKGRLTSDISEKGIVLMSVKMTVLTPDYASFKSIMVKDPS